jgi:hypothetical protein
MNGNKNTGLGGFLCDQCGNCIYYKEDPEEFGEEGECTCEDSYEFEEVVGFDDESCFDYEEKEI